MGEFQQAGSITTIHGFYDLFEPEDYLSRLESKLMEFSRHAGIGLLLPSLYTEIHVPKVLDNIIRQINQVDYLCSVVVALGGTSRRREFKEAREYFYRLKKKNRDVKVIWVEGARIQKIFGKLKEQKISPGVPGKGQSVWITMGYMFAKEQCEVIALHDCDIATYDRLLLGRLIEPTAIMYLIGTEMDFQADKLGNQFVFNNPNQTGACGCGESVNLVPATGAAAEAD